MKKSGSILILGGNGFIGAEVTDYLLNNYKHFDLVLLNRGHWNEWDYKHRIKPFIAENLIWDRKEDSLKKCLKKYLDLEGFQFEAIIDFSAYKRRDVRNVLKDIPSEKFKRYILISSDSVYEVCNQTKKDELITEIDSVRPESKEEQKQLKENDSYGHHKLECEEKLINVANESANFNYIILRVSDVLGARDSTERFWFYQMWIQYLNETLKIGEIHEISIPEEYYNTKTCFTYVKDISKVIGFVLESEVQNEIFNLGCETPLSLIDFHNLLASKIKPGLEESFKYKLEKDSRLDYHLFPSVARGPVSYEKIKKAFNFEPTDISRAFEEIVNFYNSAYQKFAPERKSIVKSLKKQFFRRTHSLEFDNFIKTMSE